MNKYTNTFFLLCFVFTFAYAHKAVAVSATASARSEASLNESVNGEEETRQDSEKKNLSLTPPSAEEIQKEVADYIEQNKELLSDDTLLANLLALPYEKRQYVFPYLHEQPFLSHKIKSHPQIIVWKGKKPTVIAPQMQAFAKKYLDDLPAVFYYFLDPDYWNGTTPSEQTVTQTLLNPNAPETKAKSATEIANYAVRSLYEVYRPSEEIKENYYQTILSKNDVVQLENTLLKLNDFVDSYPQALSIPSALRDSLGIRVKESVAAPFEEWVKNVGKLGLSEDLRTFLKQQGWKDENDFAKKADVMLRAVRVNRMSLPQAMAFSDMRLKYYPIDETKPLTSTQMYLKMHDAKPGDALFITPYADELKKSFEQGKFTRIGLPIYID